MPDTKGERRTLEEGELDGSANPVDLSVSSKNYFQAPKLVINVYVCVCPCARVERFITCLWKQGQACSL